MTRGEPEVVAQDLDRDVPAEDRVTREEHPPHAPLAKDADDLVAADVRDEVHGEGV